MPANITDISEFTSPVVVPVDGDPRNAASVQLPFQQLANRTTFLLTYGFKLRGQPIVYTSGSGTYTPDAVVSAVRILAVGGGGGGGGAQGGSAPAVAAGGGGSSGSAIEVFVPRAAVAGSYVFDYLVGAGGSGGIGSTGSDGSSGGLTSIELDVADLQVFAYGGAGGDGMTSGTTARKTLDTVPGTTPIVTGAASIVAGAILSRQNAGPPGFAVDVLAVPGAGAPSAFGGARTSVLGVNAESPGAGGSGSAASTSSRDGGDGANGLIIVWEFI